MDTNEPNKEVDRSAHKPSLDSVVFWDEVDEYERYLNAQVLDYTLAPWIYKHDVRQR